MNEAPVAAMKPHKVLFYPSSWRVKFRRQFLAQRTKRSKNDPADDQTLLQFHLELAPTLCCIERLRKAGGGPNNEIEVVINTINDLGCTLLAKIFEWTNLLLGSSTTKQDKDANCQIVIPFRHHVTCGIRA